MDRYLAFVMFAVVVAVVPGPDTLLTLRASLLGGRIRGLWTMLGICVAGSLQGVLAATGLGALLVNAEPIFLAIKWIGAAYLVFLGVMALRTAWKLRGMELSQGEQATTSRPLAAIRTGFLTNITNPKVLAFNVAVLPQFVSTDAGLPTLLVYAMTLTVVGALVLLAIVLGASYAADLLRRRRVRQSVEAGSGAVMIAFAGVLLTEG